MASGAVWQTGERRGQTTALTPPWLPLPAHLPCHSAASQDLTSVRGARRRQDSELARFDDVDCLEANQQDRRAVVVGRGKESAWFGRDHCRLFFL
jgi:hypothetical protein